MYDEGIRLYEKFGDVATIKVPCTREGLIVCKRLSEQGIKVNVTLIFCAAQAVLAAKGPVPLMCLLLWVVLMINL